MSKKIECKIGEPIGKCVYLGEEYRLKGRRYALFQCKCGKTFNARVDLVNCGGRTTCGCFYTVVKHGQAGHGNETSEYKTWHSMKDRCLNPNNPYFKNYGGRGISVCDRWIGSFENFYADMGKRPSSEHSLDRFPNNDGNYEPLNCRWATVEEQSDNRRNTKFLTHKNTTLSLRQWAKTVPMTANALWARIFKYGWTIERALTKPNSPIQPQKFNKAV